MTGAAPDLPPRPGGLVGDRRTREGEAAGDRIAADVEAGRLANPIGGVALGDPFVLRPRGRFCPYGPADGPALVDGRMIPVCRSDDLIHWEPLGGALIP